MIVSIWFLGGATILCLGITGVYLSQVFVQTKGRPRTVVADIHEYTSSDLENPFWRVRNGSRQEVERQGEAHVESVA